MGLERLAAVLQHVHGNYEIDLFQPPDSKAAELTGTSDLDNKSLRVIADHIRACSFLIVDGVLPSNEGRGYVLRRIIRRAVRHFWKLGTLGGDGYFWRLVGPLCEVMGDAYPELVAEARRSSNARSRPKRPRSRKPSTRACCGWRSTSSEARAASMANSCSSCTTPMAARPT